MKYYLSLPFIWVARAAYDIHIRLDGYTSWILAQEEDLFTPEELERRFDSIILTEMENNNG